MVRRPIEENVEIELHFRDLVPSSNFLAINVRKTPTMSKWQRCTCCVERQQMSYEDYVSLQIFSIYLCLIYGLAALYQDMISRHIYRYISLRATCRSSLLVSHSLIHSFVFFSLSFAVG